MKAYVFPGQGSQFAGMGKAIAEEAQGRDLLAEADDILGFKISEVMTDGSDEDLRQTRITQPAIYIHSLAAIQRLGEDFAPGMAAGHSLGEFSALAACGAISFAEGLKLVSLRAEAMQRACMAVPGTMAAILGGDDEVVDQTCREMDAIVVAANYNSPGQVVISGTLAGVEMACAALKERGAKRAIMLTVGGAFHSPLMEPARAELAEAIGNATFSKPRCPIYQNVDAMPHSQPEQIRINLISQLTAPVRWTDTIQQMIRDGAIEFHEAGPGKVLQGLIKKIDPSAITLSV